VLEVSGLSAGYGKLSVVHDFDVSVDGGEIVGLIGRNGAGKTTTLLAIAGFITARSGAVSVDGQKLSGPAYRRTARHLGIVLEGRSTFPSLTVAQNLAVADVDRAAALELFPELEPRLNLAAGMLSGGQQQMLALARAIARSPRALLIDELSFGLAPVACEALFTRLKDVIRRTQMAVLLVEQHIHYAEAVCDRVLVMGEGRVQLETTAADLANRATEIERLYLSDVVGSG
jgi:branched-chain amino acid transport system ATP-binding protein